MTENERERIIDIAAELQKADHHVSFCFLCLLLLLLLLLFCFVLFVVVSIIVAVVCFCFFSVAMRDFLLSDDDHPTARVNL